MYVFTWNSEGFLRFELKDLLKKIKNVQNIRLSEGE
jgi:hypothetical protein